MNAALIGVSVGQLITMVTGFWSDYTLERAAIYTVFVIVMSTIAEHRHRKQFLRLAAIATEALEINEVRRAAR